MKALPLTRILRLLGYPLSVVSPPEYRSVPVLAYHGVSGSSTSDFDLPARLFRDQFNYVDTHYTVIDISSLESAGPQLAQRCCVLTFDDAYEDFYDTVYPLLIDTETPATLYVPAGLIGSHKRQSQQGSVAGGTRLCSWPMLKELSSSGLVRIGSHGMTHRDFRELSGKEQMRELADSRKLLEDRLGREIRDFAWPYGYSTARSRHMAISVYHRIARFAGGPVDAASLSPAALPRIPVRRSDGLQWFRKKLAGVGCHDETLRSVAKDVGFALKRFTGYPR